MKQLKDSIVTHLSLSTERHVVATSLPRSKRLPHQKKLQTLSIRIQTAPERFSFEIAVSCNNLPEEMKEWDA